MGALTHHEKSYPTEWPSDASRTLEITTFNNCIDIRISSAGNEIAKNGRTAVILTKQQAQELIADLQSATDYLSGD